jgi:hypothetical protein
MTARMWNPQIEAETPGSSAAFAEVDDSAVPVLRQAGWLLASERDEHLDRVAAHPSQNPDAAAEADDAGTKTSSGRQGSGKAAGRAGSEGS